MNNQLERNEQWKTVSLFQVLESLENGSRPKGGIKEIAEGIPSIGGEHLNSDGRFDFKNLKLVSKEFYSTLKRGKIEPQDVLVVKDGATTGKTSFIGNDFPFKESAVNEHVFILRGKKEVIEQKFLFYHLRSPIGQRQIDVNFHGAAIGGINTQFAKNYFINLPPLDAQRQLVPVLEKAEQLQQWRKESDKLTNAYIQSIFLNKFGEPKTNPKKWKASNLGGFLNLITYGLTVRPNYIQTGIPLISAREISKGIINYEHSPRISATDYERLSENAKPKKGDILFSKTGTIGYCAEVKSNQVFAITQNAARLVFKKEYLLNSFVLFYLRTNFVQSYAKNLVKGNAVKDLQLKDMKTIPLYLPPIYVQKDFEKILRQIEQIKEYQEQLAKKSKDLSNLINSRTFQM